MKCQYLISIGSIPGRSDTRNEQVNEHTNRHTSTTPWPFPGPPAERATVTIPAELVAGIDRIEIKRSRFICEAVRHEPQRRQCREPLHSLEDHHPHRALHIAPGLTAWAEALPAEVSDLPDPAAGVAVCWTHAHGWQEREP